MCHFAIAELGFKYLRINFSLMPRHPPKKPHLVAFNRVKFFGLHKDWGENLTALALVMTECVNIARAGWTVRWGARPIQGPGCDTIVVTTKGNPVVTCPSWQLNILCALAGPVLSDVGVVPTPPREIGIIHRSVEGS